MAKIRGRLDPRNRSVIAIRRFVFFPFILPEREEMRELKFNPAEKPRVWRGRISRIPEKFRPDADDPAVNCSCPTTWPLSRRHSGARFQRVPGPGKGMAG